MCKLTVKRPGRLVRNIFANKVIGNNWGTIDLSLKGNCPSPCLYLEVGSVTHLLNGETAAPSQKWPYPQDSCTGVSECGALASDWASERWPNTSGMPARPIRALRRGRGSRGCPAGCHQASFGPSAHPSAGDPRKEEEGGVGVKGDRWSRRTGGGWREEDVSWQVIIHSHWLVMHWCNSKVTVPDGKKAVSKQVMQQATKSLLSQFGVRMCKTLREAEVKPGWRFFVLKVNSTFWPFYLYFTGANMAIMAECVPPVFKAFCWLSLRPSVLHYWTAGEVCVVSAHTFQAVWTIEAGAEFVYLCLSASELVCIGVGFAGNGSPPLEIVTGLPNSASGTHKAHNTAFVSMTYRFYENQIIIIIHCIQWRCNLHYNHSEIFPTLLVNIFSPRLIIRLYRA